VTNLSERRPHNKLPTPWQSGGCGAPAACEHGAEGLGISLVAQAWSKT